MSKNVRDNLIFEENKPWKLKTFYVEPSEGKHEGSLKGINGKKRDAIVENNLELLKQHDDSDRPVHDLVLEIIRKDAIKSKPILNFESFKEKRLKYNESLNDYSIDLALEGLGDFFRFSTDGTINLIDILIKNNFVLEVSPINKNLEYLSPGALENYGALFYHKEKFTWVIFEEFREAISGFDRTEINKEKLLNSAFKNTSNKLSTICGVVKPVDVYLQFQNWNKDLDVFNNSFSSFYKYMKKFVCIYDEECDFEMIEPKGIDVGTFLVSKELFEKHEFLDIDEDYFEYEDREKEFYDEFRYIIDCQSKIIFKILPKKLRDVKDIYDYYISIPEVQEFREFFDERVPNEKDDLNYADMITDDFIWWNLNEDFNISNIRHFYETKCLKFNEEEISEYLNRFTNAINALPRWDKYGQSCASLNDCHYFDIGDLKISHKENFTTNENFTESSAQTRKVKKIGRNEPCPCGSGKKYKKCCGRGY